MGQTAVCQGVGATDGVVEHPGSGCGLPANACACLPSKSLAGQCAGRPECIVDKKLKESDLSCPAGADDYETDDSSGVGSEHEADKGHLTLARSRVFNSHHHVKFQDCYRIVRLLGEGSYGNVYEATTAATGSSEGRSVAAKCFVLQPPQAETVHHAERVMREIASRRASFERERSILCRLEHPHLVKMYECFEDKTHLWIVLELCRGGELYECIADQVRKGMAGGLEEQRSRVFFRQMLYATSYLHACRVVHRDVKTENFLLLGEPGSPNGEIIKLCDFGTAVQLTAQQPRAMERIGTLSYTAPEVYERKGATVLSDAWSLGVVLYVLLVGASPFRTTGEEPRDVTVRRIQAGQYDQSREAWKSLGVEAQDLVRRFLIVDETKRLSSSEALRHGWVDLGHTGVLLPASNVARPVRASPRGPDQFAKGAKEPTVVLDADSGNAILRLFWRFAKLDALQQLLLVVCAQMTSEEMLMQVREPVPWYDLFFALDVNEDGRVDFSEFVQGLLAVLDPAGGNSQEIALESLARALDLDCSGSIDWVEWVAVALLARHRQLSRDAEPMRTAFRLLDRPSGDGNLGAADILGVISVGAAHGIPSRYGREVAHQLMSKWVSPSSSPSEPQQKKGKSSSRKGAGGTPVLAIADVRRAIDAASDSAVEQEDTSMLSLYTPRSRREQFPVGCFQCCMTSQNPPQSGSKVLINQHRATPPFSPRRPSRQAEVAEPAEEASTPSPSKIAAEGCRA